MVPVVPDCDGEGLARPLRTTQLNGLYWVIGGLIFAVSQQSRALVKPRR